MKELIKHIEQWFIDRNLHTAHPQAQLAKLLEEAGELSKGVTRSDDDSIKDSVGDVAVVLIGLCMQLDVNFEECVLLAYNEIKDRKGKLIDGVFVKEEDL